MNARPVINDQSYADEREANVAKLKNAMEAVPALAHWIEWNETDADWDDVFTSILDAVEEYAEAERERRNGYDRAYEASMPREM